MRAGHTNRACTHPPWRVRRRQHVRRCHQRGRRHGRRDHSQTAQPRLPASGALEIARDNAMLGEQYLIVGDGSTDIAQSDGGAPMLVAIDSRDGDGYDFSAKSYSTKEFKLGTTTASPIDSVSDCHLTPEPHAAVAGRDDGASGIPHLDGVTGRRRRRVTLERRHRNVTTKLRTRVFTTADSIRFSFWSRRNGSKRLSPDIRVPLGTCFPLQPTLPD